MIPYGGSVEGPVLYLFPGFWWLPVIFGIPCRYISPISASAFVQHSPLCVSVQISLIYMDISHWLTVWTEGHWKRIVEKE